MKDYLKPLVVRCIITQPVYVATSTTSKWFTAPGHFSGLPCTSWEVSSISNVWSV